MDDRRVIVVGSGPPGAAAALFLSRAGADVLLLEAGAERAATGLTVRALGVTVLKRRRTLRQRPGMTASADPNAEFFEDLAPGGLSNHWSCAVPRFAPEDFADAARAGEEQTWPIGYEDLAPWYDRVEPLLHIAGPAVGSDQLPSGRIRHERRLGADWAPVAAEARNIGRTLTPMPYAYGAASTVTLSGTAFNSFVRLVQPELRAGRLKARFEARVVRLEWSKRERRVEAVVFRDARSGVENRVSCRAVVLAAGAIGTPEILLASKSADFPDGLGNTHDVLGRYLHDHPLGKVLVDLGVPISALPPCYLTRPTLENAPPLYAAACMQWSGAEVLARSLVQRTPGRLDWLGFSVFGTMAPTKDDWVALAPGKQRSLDATALDLHVRHPPEAHLALDKARDDLIEVLERAGLRPRVRVWKVEAVGNSRHYGGSCRMHASTKYGMIDAWNRLHAVPNVAVVDSSAFTTGPEKNPVLTAMAISARASDRLALDVRDGDL